MSKEYETNYLGNGSTFIKYIAFLIAGRVIAIGIAHGINLPIDQYTLAELIGYILGFIGATIDAKYHNNINWNWFKKILKSKPAYIEDDTEPEIFDNDPPLESDNYE